MPERIQRKRARGWRMPEGAVYVGRPTRWGNPYAVPGAEAGRQDGMVFDPTDGIPVFSRTTSVLAFRAWTERHEDRAGWLLPLRGRDLVCWCPLDQPCHADVLLELANR